MKDEMDLDESTYQSVDEERYRELIEENQRRIKNLTATLNEMKRFAEQLEKKSEKQRLEYEEENRASMRLKKIMEDLQKDNKQKTNVIRDLTMKFNRKTTNSDKEFDLVMEKLQETRDENKHLKIDILKLQEENEKLANEIFCLKESMKVVEVPQQQEEYDSSIHESSEGEEEEEETPKPQKEIEEIKKAPNSATHDDELDEEELRTVDIVSESESESKSSLEDST